MMKVGKVIAHMKEDEKFVDVVSYPVKDVRSLHLVCFMASVVKDVRRLGYLKRMIDSVRKQYVPLTGGLLVSIHVDPSLGMSAAEIKSLFDGIPRVYILLQKRPKLQFMQMHEMFVRWATVFPCPDGRTPYIIFSDDDDLWHPHRTHYYHALHVGSAYREDVTGICLVERAVTKNLVCAPSHENDVDSMIVCGCVVYEHVHGGEYHQLAVKPVVLRDFFSQFTQLCERNRYADMQFRNFVYGYGGNKQTTVYGIPSTWAYFYRQCDSSYACNRVPQIDFDPNKEFDIYRDRPALTSMVKHVIDLEECPATKDMAERQLRHYAKAVTGGDKGKLLIFMSFYAMIKNCT